MALGHMRADENLSRDNIAIARVRDPYNDSSGPHSRSSPWLALNLLGNSRNLLA